MSGARCGRHPYVNRNTQSSRRGISKVLVTAPQLGAVMGHPSIVPLRRSAWLPAVSGWQWNYGRRPLAPSFCNHACCCAGLTSSTLPVSWCRSATCCPGWVGGALRGMWCCLCVEGQRRAVARVCARVHGMRETVADVALRKSPGPFASPLPLRRRRRHAQPPQRLLSPPPPHHPPTQAIVMGSIMVTLTAFGVNVQPLLTFGSIGTGEGCRGIDCTWSCWFWVQESCGGRAQWKLLAEGTRPPCPAPPCLSLPAPPPTISNASAVAVGFAAQSTMQNVVSALQIVSCLHVYGCVCVCVCGGSLAQGLRRPFAAAPV